VKTEHQEDRRFNHLPDGDGLTTERVRRKGGFAMPPTAASSLMLPP
jgi:hypothetical protein